MKKRIAGLDIARALAVIGMIIVNFKMVLGYKGESWLLAFAEIFSGKAAATFVVLAGIGLALMTKNKIGDKVKMSQARLRILKRAIFLFMVGLSYIWVWPADILHFYGIYMLITLIFVNQKAWKSLISSGVLITIYPVLIIFLNYETAWNFSTLEYADFWTSIGFIRNLFFNGFHPVIPWTAFMLFGLWFGRQDLYNDSFVKKSFWISLISFFTIQSVSKGLLSLLTRGDSVALEALNPIFGTSPMPPLPFYMLNGIAVAVTIISGCIILGRRFESSKILSAMGNMGKLALTFYVAHVILGMGLVEELCSTEIGEFSIQFSLIYAFIFSLICVIFANIWLRFFKMGPLEWLMRKITG